jgi:hypothetical protein
MREFQVAPWPTALKVVSLLGTVLVGGVTVAAIRVIPPVGGFTQRFGTGVACVPPAIIIFSLLFVVRSYRIEGGHLAIGRLFWETTVPLLGIHEAWHDPAAIKGALRIWGNGGLFGITGYYWNKSLGRFRLFATDPRKAVILKLHNRTVVVSPADPEGFLQELQHQFPRLVQPSASTAPPAQ